MANSLPQLPPLSSTKLDESGDENSKEESEEITSEENSSIEEETVSSKYIDSTASFFATFIDGSSLRYLTEYLLNYSTQGTFVFEPNYITYQKSDEDENIFNHVKLKTYELTDYEFSSKNSEITATINLTELRNKTRTVGKKEQVDIYRRSEEPSNFYVQVRSQEKSSGGEPMLYCMTMKNQSVTMFQLPEYSRGKHNPNCTIYQSDLSKVCKAMIANKCRYGDFIGYNKGILIKAYNSEGKISMVKEYGKCDKKSEDAVIEKFRIYPQNIKNLSKLNGFSPNCTIKFYIEKGAPLKLTCGIGAFGKLTVLIRTSED